MKKIECLVCENGQVDLRNIGSAEIVFTISCPDCNGTGFLTGPNAIKQASQQESFKRFLS